MPDRGLNEPPINAVLGEVCHPRVPKTMRSKAFRQPKRIAVGDETGVDLRRRDPAAAFGDPHRRMLLAAEAGPDVLDVVGDRLHRPAHHRRHVAASRRLPAHRLAVTPSTAIYTHVSGDFMNTALRKALGPAFEPHQSMGREEC